jgi:hypothetical protein
VKWYSKGMMTKELKAIYRREWVSKNKERILKYKAKWKATHKYKDEYASIKRHPIKQWCRQQFYNARRRGDIIRGDCRDCGAKNADAHHTNYRKPLLVTWLCRRCHGIEHRKYK